jgi:hypothetical protein
MDAAIPERALDEPPPTASLRGTVAGLVAGRDAVSDECQRLFKQVEARCPGYLPPSPLDPDGIGPEIPLNPDELQKLVMVAVPKAAGLQGSGVLRIYGGSSGIHVVGRNRTVVSTDTPRDHVGL